MDASVASVTTSPPVGHTMAALSMPLVSVTSMVNVLVVALHTHPASAFSTNLNSYVPGAVNVNSPKSKVCCPASPFTLTVTVVSLSAF